MSYSLDTILPSPKDGIKGDIFIRCPTTGQPVPTGLHTGTVVFDTLPKIEMRMHCPACQRPLVGLHQGLGHRKHSTKLEPRVVCGPRYHNDVAVGEARRRHGPAEASAPADLFGCLAIRRSV